MMSESRPCMFLLLNAFAGLLSVSDAGITLKYVCPGDSVQAFQNIKFNHCNANVSLNINGERNAQIATWLIQNCTQNETLLPEYQGRVIFDQNGTITIHNFHHFDQAKYVVISKMDPLPKIYEVQLYLMVAPTKDCKPMIEKLGNSLIASLKANVCGKPVAIPYWKDYGGVSNTNEPILKLTPGHANTYYACIKGDALTCAKNVTPQDYCSTFITEGSNSPPVSLETCNKDVLTALCIVFGILLILAILAITVIFIRDRRSKKNINRKQNMPLLEIPKLWTKYFDNLNWADIKQLLNRDQQMGLQTYCENLNREQTMPLLEIPQLWTKHFDKLNWEDIRQLLTGDQQMGLQTYCDNLKSQIDNRRRVLETQSHIEHESDEASTEQQTCTDPEKMRELKELRDAARCKICFVNKMSVFFMPCSHIATCSSCSSSLPQCPVCRAVIEEKLNICFD